MQPFLSDYDVAECPELPNPPRDIPLFAIPLLETDVDLENVDL